MSKMNHFITWTIKPEELEDLADKLRRVPVLSLTITEGVELLLRRKKK